jgi:dienelactone hydrolase
VAELNKNPDFTLSDFIPKWLVKMDDGQGNQVQKTTLLLREWMPRVKQMFGNPDTKYGIVGFCFGAPYVLDYCSYSRHPPMLNTRDQKLKSPPLFLLASRHNQ